MEVNFIDQALSSKASSKIEDIKRKSGSSESSDNFAEMLTETISEKETKQKPVDKKLMDTCIEMESLFVKQMLSSMKKNVDKGEFLHGGYAEEIFEDMLYDEYALNMSKNSNMGIAKSLYEELSRIR